MKINLLKIISVLIIGTSGLVNGQRADRIRDFAVLISGAPPSAQGSYDGGIRDSYDEFWNDTYLMWEIHYTKTGMQDHPSSDDGQIRVIYADGMDWPGASWRYQADNPNHPVVRVTDYSAYYNDVANIFTWLKDGCPEQDISHGMDEDEELFCWTFDHGDTIGYHSFLCLMDQNMVDHDFADRVNQINAGKRVFWMQQCFSGGFIDDLADDKNIIITACSATELASRADSVSRNGSPLPENELGNHHGEFDFHIMNAVRGTAIYPYNNPPVVDADENDDGGVSMSEAWTYLYDHESQEETPQFSDEGNISATTFLDYAPPSAPPNLTGYTNVNGVFLDWDPSIENETAIKYYRVTRTPKFRCLTDTLPPVSSFWDWNVKSYTTYRYRIRAYDLALNWSRGASYITITTGHVNPGIPYESGPQIVAEQTMDNNGMIINQNPVIKSAMITLSIMNPGYVNLTVYDTQGRKVKDILNTHKPAGIHSVNFDAKDLEAGVYFLRLDTDKFKDIQKVVIVQ